MRGRGGDLRVGSAAGGGEFGVGADFAATAGLAQGTVLVVGGQLNAESVAAAGLAPGRIVIRGGQIAFAGATLSSVNTQPGEAGSIDVAATGAGIVAHGGLVLTRTNGAGRGADVRFSAPALRFDQFSRTQTVSGGPGRGGDIRYVATGTLDLVAAEADPGYTSVASFALAGGRGGDVLLRGDTVTIDAAIAGTNARAAGAGGALRIDGGDIDLRAGTLIHLRRGEISTAVGSGAGAGGNIFVDPVFVLLEQGSRVVANAFGGPGGNISIVASYFFNAPDTTIDASSALGVPGTVQILTPNLDATGALSRLPVRFLDASSLLRSACAVRGGAGASGLTAVGRGGLPAAPEQWATGSYFEPAASVASASVPVAPSASLFLAP